MKRSILIIALLFSLTTFKVVSQNIKTYSGKYSEDNASGDATYEYYENENFERIYHGNFKFSRGNSQSKLSGQIYREVLGRFNNNFKDGLWTYKTKNEEVSGNFVMGLPNGEWIRKEIDPKTGKMEVFEKVNYKNGKMYGNFYYKGEVGNNTGLITRAEVSGKIDDGGYVDGPWTIKWNDVEDIRKYKDGILYFRIVRNIETGDVAYKVDSTNFVNVIYNNLDKLKMSSFIGSSN